MNLQRPVVFAIGAIMISLGVAAPTAQAQSTTSADEYSFYLGEDLPSGIDNVTEILPVFGARYGLPTLHLGTAELGLFNTHAGGVDFSTLEASLRGSFTLSTGIDALYYGGVDFNYYLPENASDRKTATGLHAGAGAMMAITDNLWLRADLKFMGGPGTSLFLLFGLVFK